MLFAAAAAAAILTAAAPSGLTVRLYDLYGLSPRDRAGMMAVAAETLADAGVALRWTDCSRVDDLVPAGCRRPPSPGEVVLRIQDRTARGARILGTALVREDGGPNVLASIYAGSIADRAARTGVPAPTILGRVAAHEIGHLLLGSNSHSEHGLMRASWDVKWRHPSEWRFSRADAAAIRSRLRPGSDGEVAALVTAPGGAR